MNKHSFIYCFIRIKTADGTRSHSFKVFSMSIAVNVFLGKVVVSKNGRAPSVLLDSMYEITLDNVSVALNVPVMAVPLVRRNCKKYPSR